VEFQKFATLLQSRSSKAEALFQDLDRNPWSTKNVQPNRKSEVSCGQILC